MQLSNDNVARAVEDIEKFFRQANVSDRDCVKIQLVVEEALLLWQKHFGTERDFDVKIYKSKWLMEE